MRHRKLGEGSISTDLVQGFPDKTPFSKTKISKDKTQCSNKYAMTNVKTDGQN
jgi:hypothetical protein